MSKEVFVIDLDGTICTQETYSTYQNAKPKKEVIKKINSLWTDGHKIVIFTARGMNTHDGQVEMVEQNLRQITTKWLDDNRVCYDELVFGKPPAYKYVDDKAMRPDEFLGWEWKNQKN